MHFSNKISLNPSSFLGRFLCIGTLLISILILSGVSFAQEKGGQILQQLEKKEFVPKETPKPVIEKKEEKPIKVQEAIEGSKIFIKQINVQGATLLNGQTIKDIIHTIIPSAPLTENNNGFIINKELSFPEMYQIAEAMTEKYRDLGYIVAYAFVPQQEIKEGVLEIRVKEGKAGKITVTGNKSYSTSFILKHIEKIKDDASPKRDTLERSMLILNDYPSLNVKAQLKAGKEPGTTDINAEAKDSFPISGSLSYDNSGASTTSKNRLTASLNMGNLVTSGDLLMLRGLTGLDRIDTAKLSYGRADYVLPINYIGTKAGVYYSNAVYKVGEQFEVLEMNGKADVVGVYITHPFIKRSDRTLEAKFGFDYKDIYDYMLGDVWTKTKTRVFNLGATYDFTDSFYGRNVLNLAYYHGVRYLFGGSGQNDPDTSRLNGDGEFNKYTIDVTRAQKLPGYNHLMFKASGQYSADNLFVVEQFMIGGASGVRGFRPSSLSGDSGYLVSAELHLSPIYPEKKIFSQKIGDTIKFVLFADNGGVYKNNALAGEDKDDYQTSLGVGLRLYYGKYLSAKVDWAVPDVEGKYETKNAETYFQITLSF